jgi:hypothetical protein
LTIQLATAVQNARSRLVAARRFAQQSRGAHAKRVIDEFLTRAENAEIHALDLLERHLLSDEPGAAQEATISAWREAGELARVATNEIVSALRLEQAPRG